MPRSIPECRCDDPNAGNPNNHALQQVVKLNGMTDPST
jgi:hypothetical protein